MTLHLCEVPQLERVVRTTGQRHAAVRREGNRVDQIQMPGKAEKGVARCNIPKPERPVLTAGQRPTAVRRERNRADTSRMPGKDADFAASNVPKREPLVQIP